MQNEAKSLLLPRLQTITNGRIEDSCLSPTKLKPSLKDLLCYSESIYVSFNLNKLTPLHLWPLLGGILERKWEKAKKCLQPTRNTHVAKGVYYSAERNGTERLIPQNAYFAELIKMSQNSLLA